MCGISGIVYNDGYGDFYEIKNMTDAIAHRGPDGEGYVAVNTHTNTIHELAGPKTPLPFPPLVEYKGASNIYLSHRRLSIIDLSPLGHQPMSNNDKTLWLTFNGEIYNYKTIRNELIASGFSFKSDSDTEVLLASYEKWGSSCLTRFNGMFAFVIYDKKKQILFGARDPFGVKPLYYANEKDFFAFNSEIKGLTVLNRIPKTLNEKVAYEYLQRASENSLDETFFKHIFELPPSYCFTYSLLDKKFLLKKYYELSFTDDWESFSERKCTEYIAGVKERVLESIRLRLNADVTVGSCLSGGLDSSAIVCSIHHLLQKEIFSSVGKKQGVVTACFPNSAIDESKWAKLVVEKTNAQWFPCYPQKEELFNDLQDLIYYQDVPFGSTSIYAQYQVMKTAKENNLTVMLDGQGGDELFTGYTPYYDIFYAEALRNHDKALLNNEKKYIQNAPVNINSILNFKKKLKLCAKQYFPTWAKDIIVSFLNREHTRYLHMEKSPYNGVSYKTLNQMLYTLMTVSSLPQLLKYEDRNSMRFSIESRTPFADDINLIDYVFAIPSVYKIHNGWSKYLLRESMKNIIPEQIRHRTDKIGFQTPEYDWLKNIKPVIFANRKNTAIEKIINMKRLEKDWDVLFQKQNKIGITNIWRYINFILWFNRFTVEVS